MSFEDIVALCRGLVNFGDNRYVHVAVIIKNKRKITNLKFNDYNRICIKRKLYTCMHAEHNCSKNFDKIKGKFLVLRFGKTNLELKDSKPCSVCRDMLIKKGLKYVYCSTDFGTIIKINLFELKDYQSVSQSKMTNYKNSTTYKLI